MPCDICSNETAPNIVTAGTMRRAVQMGFDPFTEGCLPSNLAQLATADSPEEWKRQAIDGLLSHRDWKLCDDCGKRIQNSGFRIQK